MIFFHEPYINKNYLFNLNKLLKIKKGLNYNYIQKKLKLIIKKKFNYKNILFTNSNTSAMEITALIIKNLKKKGNIVMPSYNYPTTASAFIRAGLNVKFIDIPLFNYDTTFRTKEIIGYDRGRFARAWRHSSGVDRAT